MRDLLIGILLFVATLFGAGWAPTPPDEPVVAPETEYAEYPREVLGRVVRVIDGDTIDVEIEGTIERVRYIGVDTPEPSLYDVPECYSEEATSANRGLVGEKEVRLIADSEARDDYGRLLRYVYVGETSVNAELARGGYADVVFIRPNTSEYEVLKALRDEARVNERGLWKECRN
jgi:micrococcal nuclease